VVLKHANILLQIYLTIVAARNLLHTDGVDLAFTFKKPKKVKIDVEPADFNNLLQNNPDGTTRWAVDPGITDAFMAVDGDMHGTHRIRKTSTKEYYDLCGYNVATAVRAAWRESTDANTISVIDSIPTMKTSQLTDFCDSVIYIMRNFSTITGYYDQEFRFNVLKFKTYKAKQKGLSKIAKRLTFGSLKYGRVPIPNHYHMTHPSTPSKPKWTNQSNCDKASEDKSHHYIIAYGNATFGNIRGKQAAPSKSIVRKLRSVCRMRSCKVSLVMIDEYNTSKVCPRCLRKSVVNAKQRPNSNSHFKQSIHAVLNCQNCFTTWNRDVMAARNIAYVFDYMRQNGNQRPEPFRRPEPVEE
jgi:hypothetical protein